MKELNLRHSPSPTATTSTTTTIKSPMDGRKERGGGVEEEEDRRESKSSRSRGVYLNGTAGSDIGSSSLGSNRGACSEGRVWIFLVLGTLLLVFSAVLAGVYMNMRTLTSSMDHVEVMPPVVPAAAGGLAGLAVLILFWKRHRLLVYPALLLSVVSALMCVIAAVLTGTHVLQPLLSVSGCRYTRRIRTCLCVSQYRREQLELEKLEDGESAPLNFEGVTGCNVIEEILPNMLFTMVGIYGVVALVSLVASIISFLVYRTEQMRKYMEPDDYELTISAPSSPSTSDNCTENQTMLPPATTTNDATTLVNIYTDADPAPPTANEDDNNTNDDGNTTPSDLIYSSSDVPMGYTEACQMRRCQSFNFPSRNKQREGSPGSSSSSQTASSLAGADRAGAVPGEGGTKLREHRKKGRRAVTLHGLDREQLMLILSLQMRYLQETDQVNKAAEREAASATTTDNNTGSSDSGQETSPEASLLFRQLQRRAMTPTPRQERLSSSRTTDDDLDYRPAKLVRSHTPQPYHFKDNTPNAQMAYQQQQQQLANLQQLQQQYLLQKQQQQQQQQQQMIPQYLQEQLLPTMHPNNQQFLLQQQLIQQRQQQILQQQQLIEQEKQKQLQLISQQKQQQELLQQQQLQQQRIQQQQQQQQQLYGLSDAGVEDEDDDELPTLITYDLRNVAKSGPIVYENLPPPKKSQQLNYAGSESSCSSNTSSLLRGVGVGQGRKLSDPPKGRPLPPVPPIEPQQPPSLSQVNPASTQNVKSTSDDVQRLQNSQTTVKEESSNTHPKKNSDASSTSESKSPESMSTKLKKKLLKKDKDKEKDKTAKKEEEDPTQSPLTAGKATVVRTDSNTSKGCPDRWQTLMGGDGMAQGQTLWENVQRKIVSDPEEPNLGPSANLDPANQLLAGNITNVAPQSQLMGAVAPPSSNVYGTSPPTHPSVPGSIQHNPPIPNGILKNHNQVRREQINPMISQPEIPHPTVPSMPYPLSPSSSRAAHMPPLPNGPQSITSPHHPRAFVPIAHSSTNNYEDIDDVSSGGAFEPIPPKKPERKHGRKVTKLNPDPSDPSQQLRPKSYLNAVDGQGVESNTNTVTPGNTQMNTLPPGTSQVKTQAYNHLAMEGPVRDGDFPHLPKNEHFMAPNGDIYTQARKVSNASNSSTGSVPQYPGNMTPQMYQTMTQMRGQGQSQQLQPHRQTSHPSHIHAQHQQYLQQQQLQQQQMQQQQMQQLQQQQIQQQQMQQQMLQQQQLQQQQLLQQQQGYLRPQPQQPGSAFQISGYAPPALSPTHQSLSPSHQAVNPVHHGLNLARHGHSPSPQPGPSPDPYAVPNEVCDTDLDELPTPRWQRRQLRSQSFSPPPYTPPPLYQSMDSINRHSSMRSTSSSSSDPHNTSYTSSECSSVPPFNSDLSHLKGYQAFAGQGYPRGRPIGRADRRPDGQSSQPMQTGQAVGLGAGAENSSPHVEMNPASQPYMLMRRCQSVEDGTKARLNVGPSRSSMNTGKRHLNHGQKNALGVNTNGFYKNLEPLKQGEQSTSGSGGLTNEELYQRAKEKAARTVNHDAMMGLDGLNSSVETCRGDPPGMESFGTSGASQDGITDYNTTVTLEESTFGSEKDFDETVI